MLGSYDVIVVGAGHAGCEAAAAAANLGASTLLITMDMTKIAQMSCNPAMGGIAKGQIIREIDALGGYSGLVSDSSAIQFRMLNRSKGPAMWSPRTQNDRFLFGKHWRMRLENLQHLFFWQDMVKEVNVKNGCVCGVTTAMGETIACRALILTSGTFLNGVIHIGEKQFGGGRIGEKASTGITECLVKMGFTAGRMKTGTPPRVDGRSLDYSKMEEQKGDDKPGVFSFLSDASLQQQRSCFVTYTNTEVHDILREGFDRSPMFNGAIQSLGPRYCPSIEDKINRFKDKDRHQIFVEPEGWNTVEIYINGFSTSLPLEIQLRALQKMQGFERCKIFRPGYAIEYDYFHPTQLKHTLETKIIENMYFAGQINGTTGYEEAAGQGIVAGINSALKLKDAAPFILSRDEAYIGVLIDDLITKGTEEPYRMFTSRAEFRIVLRQDNADLRLTRRSNDIGLASAERMRRVEEKASNTESTIKILQNLSVAPEEVNGYLDTVGSAVLSQKQKIVNLVARPGVSLSELKENVSALRIALSNIHDTADEALLQAEIEIKYSGYITKEQDMARRLTQLDHVKIPLDIDYHNFAALSMESRVKLDKARPVNLGQASRISGISPSDLSILLVHLTR
jgi:tRNA uridine 5-carboxymethylaminomethyl modification enzyme